MIGRLMRAGAALASLAAAGSLAASAAAAPAPAGSTFGFGQLPMPANSIAAAGSGYGLNEPARSALSDDGRYLVFVSTANALSREADPDAVNVFRKDLRTGRVALASRADGPRGRGMRGAADGVAVSADGGRVLFSTADRLDPADADDEPDLYLRDLAAGRTTLVTPGSDAPVHDAAISADGAYVAFVTRAGLVPGDAGTESDVYRARVADGAVELVSRIPAAPTAGNGESWEVDLSGDGRWVAFSSRATDLVAGFVDGNGAFGADVYARDMEAGDTYLISSRHDAAATGGNEGSNEPVIAGSPGAVTELRVGYTSYATDVGAPGVDADPAASVYLKSREAAIQPAELVSRSSAGVNADSRAHTASLSDDASRVVFTTDATNLGAPADYYGVYLRDRAGGRTTLVSARTEYAVNGAISADGGRAAWVEAGGATPDSDPDLENVFVRDLPSGPIRLGSRPPGSGPFVGPAAMLPGPETPAKRISGTGRYVVFATVSSRLPGRRGVTQVYRRDLQTGAIALVSRADGPGGAAVERSAADPAISGDGNLVAFSTAAGLDPADVNSSGDVYVRNVAAGTTRLVSRADGPAGAGADEGGSSPFVSGDGSRVAFISAAANLGVPGGTEHAWVRDLVAGTTVLASRADGPAGAPAASSSQDLSLNNSGRLLAFSSTAGNLHPDDADPARDVYVRDLALDTTTLASREPGLAGAKLDDPVSAAVISRDGSRLAFVTGDADAVPGTGPWAARQVVRRDLADGANRLVSATPGGGPGEAASSDPSLSADGSVVAFTTRAAGIVPGIENPDEARLLAVRDMDREAVVGPPRFGGVGSLGFGAGYASVSDNGRCVAFEAVGHNRVSGDASDAHTGYVFALRPGCRDPRLGVPVVAAVKVKPKWFRVARKPTARVAKKGRRARKGARISFRLSLPATVRLRFEQAVRGRKKGRRCLPRRKARGRRCVRWAKRGALTRRDLAPGRRVVPFTGRIGKRKLKPGRYRVVVVAASAAGSSKPGRAPFKVVR